MVRDTKQTAPPISAETELARDHHNDRADDGRRCQKIGAQDRRDLSQQHFAHGQAIGASDRAHDDGRDRRQFELDRLFNAGDRQQRQAQRASTASNAI